MKLNINDKYKVVFNGNDYYFDLMRINDHQAIAVFDALSNIKLANDASEDMIKVLKNTVLCKDSFDTILTAESKSITMAAYIANHFNKDLVILRKKNRDFFKEVLSAESTTYTTNGSSTLYLDLTHNKQFLDNKKVLVFDDVISTGSSLVAIEEILNKVNANIIAKAFIFNEGDAVRDKDVYYVHDLPIIEVE